MKMSLKNIKDGWILYNRKVKSMRKCIFEVQKWKNWSQKELQPYLTVFDKKDSE